MSFTLPTFNLNVNIFTGPWPGVFRSTVLGNLAVGRRVTAVAGPWAFSIPSYNGAAPTLLLPPLTDIRDASCGPNSDFVEVPAGSGRFYQVAYVDDIGKGFANEHRFAWLEKVVQGIAGGGSFPGFFWPTPIP